MLGTTAHGLHGSPHILVLWRQVPTRGHKLLARNAATVVNGLGSPGEYIRNDFAPDDIAIPFYYGVCATHFQGFMRVQRGVNAAIDHVCSTFARHASQRHAAKGVPGVNADTHDIAKLDLIRLNLFESFICDDGIAVFSRGSGGKHVQPTGSNDADSK